MKLYVYTFIMILLIFNMSFADMRVIDHRTYATFMSPSEFETVLKEGDESILEGSAVRISKGHPLVWEIHGIKNISIKDGKIDSFIQGQIVYLVDNSCGGLVLPEEAFEVNRADDYLIASDYDFHYFYSLSECAGYGSYARYGAKSSVSGNIICEIGYGKRAMRSIYNGEFLYQDSKFSEGVIAVNNGCYFIGNAGDVELITYNDEEGVYVNLDFVQTEEKILHVTQYSGNTVSGFTGYTPERLFRIDIMEFAGAEITFENMGEGVCTGVNGGNMQFCENKYNKNLLYKVLDAEYVYTGTEHVYTLRDGILKAYSATGHWEKEIYFSINPPEGCVSGGKLYYYDVAGIAYYAGDTVERSVIPYDCDFNDVYYSGGMFYSLSGEERFEYAHHIGNNIYKTESASGTIFFTLP